MRNPYRSTARGIARVGVGRAYHPPKMNKRPYVRQPRVNKAAPLEDAPPITQTPTMTGTGVTTTSGGMMPGAPDTGLPVAYQMPKVKNWAKASPAKLAQAMLAPQYASLYAQQHQAQLIAGQQQSAITSYGADLAKILGGTGPSGAKGTLPPEYAAALSMANLRQFAYTQFLESQKYADEYAKIAAQYPSYVNQIMAQRADQQLKQDSFNLQKLVAAQAYHLNLSKAKAYNAATGARISQSQQRINLSAKQYQLAVAKARQYALQYNTTRSDKASQVDVQASMAGGRWVNAYGQPLKNVPFKNPPPPYRAPKVGGKAAGIDTTRSKELGYWVYSDLTRVPKNVLNKKGLPSTPPSRYKPGGGGGNQNPGLRGLTQTQYRHAYADAVAGVQAADSQGVSRSDYTVHAVSLGIPRWVAAKAWNKYHKGK